MRTDPERELVRRAAPFGPPAVLIGLLAGVAASGWDAGWSAAVGVVIVFANFAANGYSMAVAARHSLTAVFAVGLGGFVVRLGVILAAMFALNSLEFFSPVAFGLAVIPTTIFLLGYEMKLLAGPLGQQWRIPEEPAAR